MPIDGLRVQDPGGEKLAGFQFTQQACARSATVLAKGALLYEFRVVSFR